VAVRIDADEVVQMGPLAKWALRVMAFGFFFLCTSSAFTMRPEGRPPTLGDRIGMFGFGVLTTAGFLWATRLRIESSRTGVRFVGYFRSKFVPWNEIREFVADYYFTLVKVDGSTVQSAALGKSRWRLMKREPGRCVADDVADRLNDRRSRLTSEPPRRA
jgi:hypothetical protein